MRFHRVEFIGYNSQQIGGIHGGGHRAYITLLWLAGSILFNVTLLFYVFREHQFYKWCVSSILAYRFCCFLYFPGQKITCANIRTHCQWKCVNVGQCACQCKLIPVKCFVNFAQLWNIQFLYIPLWINTTMLATDKSTRNLLVNA